MVIQLFVWTGAAVLYYFAFSIFFDTPVEYRLKHSTDRLRREYATLTERYDSLNRVMENVIARDRNVFHILFEADPYDFEEENAANRWNFYEGLLSQSTIELQKQFARRLDATERAVADPGGLLRPHGSGDRQLRLPQPDTGHPADHQQAADAAHHLLRHAYQSVPEGAALASGRRLRHSRRLRVFATADGTVKEVSLRNSTSGQTVVIDHGGGYETLYSHLGRIGVRRGQRVRRGDIIALSGNSGLSLAPHLHYEVRCNGMRVDPIHYFFMELSPDDYQRMMRIARSGMQSFD